MHVGGGADRSTSRADPPQGADGDHRAGEGDPRPACGALRSQSAACPHLRTARRGQSGSGLTVTGILEEEEIKSRQGSARRKRNARSATENALTLLEQFGFSKQDYHAHINFPGGIPIDGPSAGAAMFLALYSAYTETPVPNTLALTGEIGLHGQILPVGGVEDKLEAAQQAGATLALIPQENWREVYREMEIEVVPVGDAETLLRRVFPPGEGATLSEGMEFLVGQEIG